MSETCAAGRWHGTNGVGSVVATGNGVRSAAFGPIRSDGEATRDPCRSREDAILNARDSEPSGIVNEKRRDTDWQAP